MVENKTKPTGLMVADFLAAAEPAERRSDAQTLDASFQRVTGFKPQMWGPTIVGYGQYSYTYDSGHSGHSLAVGFSPRKTAFSVYIGAGDPSAADLLSRLGKHKIGKSCLYITRLSDIDLGVLEALIRLSLAQLSAQWKILPT